MNTRTGRVGLVLLAAILLAAPALAGPVDTAWVRYWQGPSPDTVQDQANDVLVDNSGNIYVCGAGHQDAADYAARMLVAKYNQWGETLWVRTNRLGLGDLDEQAQALALDSAGNVYAVGTSYNSNDTSMDITCMKFSSSGTLLWTHRSGWTDDDWGMDIAIGRQGDVYICGAENRDTANQGLSAYVFMRLDSANGNRMWYRSYVLDTNAFAKKRDKNPEFFQMWDMDFDNCAVALDVGADSNLVVTGFGLSDARYYDMWTMKARPNGDTLWRRAYDWSNSNNGYTDAGFDVEVANNNYIYIAGTAEPDDNQGLNYAVFRYPPNGGARTDVVRQSQNDAMDMDDWATSVVLDDSNPQNAYFTGVLDQYTSLNRRCQMYTTKYSAGLALRWQAEFGMAGASYIFNDYGNDICYKNGRVYVAGDVQVTGITGSDAWALCYPAANPAAGLARDSLWSFQFNSPMGNEDYFAAVAVVDSDHVYAAGVAAVPSNFGFNGLVLTRLLYSKPDVSVKRFESPPDTVDLNTIVTPTVRIANLGNTIPRFKSFLKIGTSYSESTMVGPIRSGDTASAIFPDWRATPLGRFAMRCSAASWPDTAPSSNVLRDSVFVTIRDAACMRIVAPTGVVDSGSEVVPQAWIRNYGTMAQNISAWFKAGSFYTDTASAAVPAGDSVLLGFRPCSLNQRGTWGLACSTMLTGDTSALNDRATGSVRVRVRDIAALLIAAPSDTVDSGSTPVPMLRVVNHGSDTTLFDAVFQMEYSTDTIIYVDTVSIALAPAAESSAAFSPPAPLTHVGLWSLSAWNLTSDQHPENDTVRKTMLVVPPGGFWPVGWVEVASVPTGLSGKAVKAGGSVAPMASTGRIYVTKGFKTAEFYAYEPTPDRWSTLTPVPPGAEGKPVYTGSDLCADGNGHIYMTKGNNTVGFWKYTVADSSWTQMENVPLGLSGKKVKAGTGLAWVDVGGTQYVYMLKGYKNEFYRFNVQTGSWELRAPAPVGLNYKYDKGSFIVHDNANTIFAHKSKYNELWKYDLAKDSWVRQLTGMPLYGASGRKKKSKDGGSGGWYDGTIYAFKGGNTTEFWRYIAAKDSWKEAESIPSYGSSMRRKKVKDGGDLGYYAHAFWALKGNKTREFWRYGLPLGVPAEPEPAREGVAGWTPVVANSTFEVVPNPMTGNGFLRYSLPAAANVSVRAYSADGRLVATLLSERLARGSGTARLNTDRLAAGIYLLRLDTGPAGGTKSFKLVVR
jgi:hypothetical protein